jgi:hypothetical protein
MKIFVYLNDCLLGENILVELFLIYVKKNGISSIWKLVKHYFKGDLMSILEKESINVNNLFLRIEVVDKINEYILKYENNISIEIISDLEYFPLNLLEINNLDDKIPVKIIYEKEFQDNIKIIHKDIKEEENLSIKQKKDQSLLKEQKDTKYILITGDFLKNIKYFFKSSKTVFVGNYFIGKIINSINAGRTEIIHRPYGVFSLFYDYFINLFGTLVVLWPLLFFLPSSNFYFWKYVFLLSNFTVGFATLWRHLLELENERKALVDKKEVLFANSFLFLHYSVSWVIVLSILVALVTLILSLQNLITFKALIYAICYAFSHFIFIGRRNKEFIIWKILTVLILSIILEPTLLKEWIIIKLYGNIN